MLRYLGVPARYVEGYYMSVDEMRNVKAGQPVKIKKNRRMRGQNIIWTALVGSRLK